MKLSQQQTRGGKDPRPDHIPNHNIGQREIAQRFFQAI